MACHFLTLRKLFLRALHSVLAFTSRVHMVMRMCVHIACVCLFVLYFTYHNTRVLIGFSQLARKAMKSANAPEEMLSTSYKAVSDAVTNALTITHTHTHTYAFTYK